MNAVDADRVLNAVVVASADLPVVPALCVFRAARSATSADPEAVLVLRRSRWQSSGLIDSRL